MLQSTHHNPTICKIKEPTGDKSRIPIMALKRAGCACLGIHKGHVIDCGGQRSERYGIKVVCLGYRINEQR
jgi:hypothetical protein